LREMRDGILISYVNGPRNSGASANRFCMGRQWQHRATYFGGCMGGRAGDMYVAPTRTGTYTLPRTLARSGRTQRSAPYVGQRPERRWLPA